MLLSAWTVFSHDGGSAVSEKAPNKPSIGKLFAGVRLAAGGQVV